MCPGCGLGRRWPGWRPHPLADLPGQDQARRNSRFVPHLNDVISAILAVNSLDSTDVQAAKHF